LKWALFTTAGLALVVAYWLSGLPAIAIGYVAGSFFIAMPFIYWMTAPGWWQSRTGRAVMMQHGALAAVFLLIMTSSLFGAYSFRELVRALIYTAAALAAVRLAVLLFQLRLGADWHNRKDTK
jgi:hypothetical protein